MENAHFVTEEEVIHNFKTNIDVGLTDKQVEDMRKLHGKNGRQKHSKKFNVKINYSSMIN